MPSAGSLEIVVAGTPLTGYVTVCLQFHSLFLKEAIESLTWVCLLLFVTLEEEFPNLSTIGIVR